MKKKMLLILAVGLLMSACSKTGFEPAVENTRTLSHGMIVLGDKLDNPYTVENIRAAYARV